MTTTPDPTPTPETPMPDPTPVPAHEQLDPDSPAGRVHRALVHYHPQPLTGADLAELVPGLGPDTLAELEGAGIVTPSTREPDAVWMLHGPARRAANEATRDA